MNKNLIMQLIQKVGETVSSIYQKKIENLENYPSEILFNIGKDALEKESYPFAVTSFFHTYNRDYKKEKSKLYHELSLNLLQKDNPLYRPVKYKLLQRNIAESMNLYQQELISRQELLDVERWIDRLVENFESSNNNSFHMYNRFKDYIAEFFAEMR